MVKTRFPSLAQSAKSGRVLFIKVSIRLETASGLSSVRWMSLFPVNGLKSQTKISRKTLSRNRVNSSISQTSDRLVSRQIKVDDNIFWKYFIEEFFLITRSRNSIKNYRGSRMVFFVVNEHFFDQFVTNQISVRQEFRYFRRSAS